MKSLTTLFFAAFVCSSVALIYPPQLPQSPQYGIFVPINQTKTSYGWNRNNVPATVYNVPQPLNQNDIVIGTRQPGDTTLFNTIVTKPVGFFRSVATKEITFPAPGSNRRINRITSIVVTDNTKNKSGGFPQIIKGGVGNSFVSLRFKSLPGRPIDSNLNIFGF